MRKLFLLLLFASCVHRASNEMTSIQLLDRNGFSETVSVKDRLANYEKTDFTNPQPYQKVVRVYGKEKRGPASIITTYHPNGQLHQLLEVMSGRAHGPYKEWYPNGKLKIEAFVIEGTPDVSEFAQMTWLFEGECRVFDEAGSLTATMPYTKGALEGTSLYYFSSGKLMKEAPYQNNALHGTVQVFNEQSVCIETSLYHEGVRDGRSISYWDEGKLKAEETYQKGRLMEAQYVNPQGSIVSRVENGCGRQALFQEGFVASLIEYRGGEVEGKVEAYNEKGQKVSTHCLKDGMKTGEEWEYYLSGAPKLFLEWDQDVLQGTCKTWYESGILESQREMQNNKKHGLSLAWFSDGDLMLMEEYEDDKLLKGSYFKKGEKTVISKVDHGKGIATLFDKSGRFLRRIPYEGGVPVQE